MNYGIRPWPSLLLAIALTGCAAFNYNEPDSPVPQLSVAPLTPKPRLALVLGSGGPRGYAHIGVMEVLESAGLEIDLDIHPDMDFAASPRVSYFRQAQAAGEVAARQLLPDLIEKIGHARLHSDGAADGKLHER